MANIDVISLIFESFYLIRAHYREVLVPVIALLLLSGAGGFGGFSILRGLGQGAPEGGEGWPETAAALSTGSPQLAGMGIIAVVLLFAAAMAFAITVLSNSIWYYICEHFYAIMKKRKITQGYQERMKRHLHKALAMTLFEFALLALFALSLAACAFLLKPFWFALAIAVLIALVALNAGFYLIPAWAFFALDGLPFFESLRRSAAMVFGSVMHFAVFAAIFLGLTLCGMAASYYVCCLAYAILPAMAIFLSLLSRITILKMKLAIEAQSGRGAK